MLSGPVWGKQMSVFRTIESYENIIENITWNDFPYPILFQSPRFNLSCGHSVPAKEVQGNVIECPKCTETAESEQSRLMALAVDFTRVF